MNDNNPASSEDQDQTPMVLNNASHQGQKVAYPNYQTTCVRNLSITVIVIGCICILFQVVDIFLRSHVSMAGAGIWGGILFIVPGVLGLKSVKLQTNGMIVAFLGLAAFGAIISISPIVAGSMGVAQGSDEWGRHYRFDGYNYPYGFDHQIAREFGEDPFAAYYNTSVAMNAVMAIAALVGGILLLLSSSYACHGLCSQQRRKQVMNENSVTSSEAESEAKRPNYKTTCVKILSIGVILLGCICFTLQWIDVYLCSQVSRAGTGIWGGVLMVIPGVLGLQSVKQRTSAKIVPFLVMAIVGTVLAIAPMVAGFIGATQGSNKDRRPYLFHGYVYPSDYDRYSDSSDPFESYYVASAVVNGMMGVAALTGVIMLLLLSLFACHGLCSGCRKMQASYVQGEAQYVTGPNNEQQMVVIPLPGGSNYSGPSEQVVSTLKPGQKVVVTNPTSAQQTIYVQTAEGGPSGLSQNEALLPPAYDEVMSPPAYDGEKPPPTMV